MAYLDPGTGSFLIQLLIGGAVGIGIAVKVFWAQISGWFKSKKNVKANPAEVKIETVDDATAESTTDSVS